jgi:hypothetical protein
MTDTPNRMVFDLELAKPIPDRNGRPNWGAAPKCGISVLCGWPVEQMFPYTWMLDSSRLPRVFLTETHAATCFSEADGVISWNGVGFDDKVMKVAAPDIFAAYKGSKHVDLMALCALLKAGVQPDKLSNGVPADWQRLAPTLDGSFLSRGWGLDGVSKASLGLASAKMKGMGGAMAPKAWQQGRYSEVASYCAGDVALTRALYLHAWEHGWLESPENGRVDIPRSVL